MNNKSYFQSEFDRYVESLTDTEFMQIVTDIFGDEDFTEDELEDALAAGFLQKRLGLTIATCTPTDESSTTCITTTTTTTAFT